MNFIMYHFFLYMIAATPFGAARFGQGEGPIVLDDLRCTGNETDILSCPYTLNHNCVHNEDAGVRCTNVISAGMHDCYGIVV